MTWTVRVFTAPDHTTWTDTAFTTQEEAYAMLWADPIPLPENHSPNPTNTDAEFGFCMFNEDGLAVHCNPAELVGSTL